MNLNYFRLQDEIIKYEGLRHEVYKCPAGKLTIGVGRNLEDTGLTEEECHLLLENDIRRCVLSLRNNFSFYEDLSDPRQEVLIQMAFQLGMAGVMKFKRMLVALQQKDFKNAAEEMLDSKWARQTTNRAVELSGIMRTGRYGNN